MPVPLEKGKPPCAVASPQSTEGPRGLTAGAAETSFHGSFMAQSHWQSNMGKLYVHTVWSYLGPWVLNNSLLIEIQHHITLVFHVPNTTANENDHTEAQTLVSRYHKRDDVALASTSLKGIDWAISCNTWQ